MAFKSNKDKSTKVGVLVVISFVALFLDVRITKFLSIAARQAFPQIALSEHQQDAPSEGIISFVPLVKKLKPQVVQISTTQISEEGQDPPSPFGEDDPFTEFWRRFFGNPGGPSREQSLGSGLIIASDGYILTNNHVIDDAEKVVVKLPSEDTEYPAKVIGKDPQLDIALIKIDAKGLPTAPLGDSDRLEVESGFSRSATHLVWTARSPRGLLARKKDVSDKALMTASFKPMPRSILGTRAAH